MKPWALKFFNALWNDEQAFVRWVRGLFGAFAVGGVAFADQLAVVIASTSAVRYIKIASIFSAFIALAITAGQKNDTAEVLAAKLGLPVPKS